MYVCVYIYVCLYVCVCMYMYDIDRPPTSYNLKQGHFTVCVGGGSRMNRDLCVVVTKVA